MELSSTAVFSAFAGDVFGFFETFRDKANMDSVVGFPLILKYVTLNDLQWPFYVNFCFCASTLSSFFENSCV